MLEFISYAIIYIIEAIIAGQYCSAILESKYSSRKTYLTLTVSYGLMFLISRFGIFWLNTCSFFIGNILCICMLFHTKLKNGLFHSLILTVTMNVTELMMIYILSWIYKDFFLTFETNMTIVILLAVSSKTLYYLTIQLTIRLFEGRKDSPEKDNFSVLLLCCVPVISTLITLTFILIGFETTIPNNINWLIIISSFLLLFINVCVYFIYTYTQKVSHEQLQLQLQLQKEKSDEAYYKMLLEQNENQQILIHDIKKHLHSILDLLNTASISDANHYIQQLLQSNALKKKIHFCDHNTMNLILSRYRELCQQNGINLFIDIRKNTINFMNSQELSALFGNLLENATEAAIGMPEAFIELSVKQIASNQLLISMINSCNYIPQKTVTGEFISQKKNSKNHGIGMRSIKKIIKNYNGSLDTYFKDEDRTFHTIITMSI